MTIRLILAFLAFCLLVAAVLHFCLRQRRRQRGSGPRLDALIDYLLPDLQPAVPLARAAIASVGVIVPNGWRAMDREHTRDDDDVERVSIMVLGAIIVGALLAVIAGYLVFFRV